MKPAALFSSTLALAAALSLPAAETAAARRPTVNVVTARKSPVAAELLLPASLQPLQEAAIYARTTGYLAKFLVDLGDHVKAGQLLAVIDSPEVDQQLNQAQAALAQAEANSILAQATAQRWQDLGRRNVVSQQDIDEKTAAATASQASFRAAQAEAARLTQLKGFDNITAPFDGIIASRGADIGTLITTDTNRPLIFRLTQQGTLRVYASIPQNYVRAMRPGLDVEVLVNEFPGRPFPGKVTRVAGALDPATRTLQTEVQIPNDDGALLPGMFAQVRFKLAPAEPPLLIPSNATIIRADGNFVAVVGAENRIKLTPVRFGRDYGTQIEIVNGLADGATIVANPSDTLVDGLVVDPLKPDAAKK